MRIAIENRRNLLIAVAASALAICSGCNSSGGGGTGPGGGTPPPTSTLIEGTAAAGWPISGAVNAKDSTGTAFGPATIGETGSYSVDVTNGTPPFLLTASGTIGLKSIVVHSVAFSGDLNGNVNITPLTELAMVNAGAQPAALFSQCTSASTCTAPSQANLAAAQTSVQAELSSAFTAFGVPSTDFRTTPFSTGAVSGQSPIDVLLDAVGFAPNATPASFNIVANIPMDTIAPGDVLGVLPPPTFGPTGAPTTGPAVAIAPALTAAVVAAATNSPKAVLASSGSAQVTLSWSAVSGATSYDIFQSKSPNVGANNGTEISNVSSPYKVSGLVNGTTYYFVVVAVVGGQSYPSAVVHATPSVALPTVSINPITLTIPLPANTPQTFVIANTGGSDSNMSYLVADNEALGGFLNVQNGLGSVQGGGSTTVTVSVLPEFASDTGLGSLVGATLGLNVYTPQASNFVRTDVAVYIVNAFPLNVSITGLTDNITNVQVCVNAGGPGACGPDGGFSVGTTGVIQVSGTLGASYTVTVPANQNAATYCTVVSGGSGDLGSDMETAVINCI